MFCLVSFCECCSSSLPLPGGGQADFIVCLGPSLVAGESRAGCGSCQGTQPVVCCQPCGCRWVGFLLSLSKETGSSVSDFALPPEKGPLKPNCLLSRLVAMGHVWALVWLYTVDSGAPLPALAGCLLGAACAHLCPLPPALAPGGPAAGGKL